MGMFDYVEFHAGNTKFPYEIRASEWQTKGLYCSMYRLIIRNDRVYYMEGDATLHDLLLTATFVIHALIGQARYYLTVCVDQGILISVWPTVDDVLPHIEAMTRDNDRLRAEMKEIVEREKP
jgi:hypothetical protein